MISLTDEQWTSILAGFGDEWVCGVRHRENGVGPLETCKGRIEVRDGEVCVFGGCGEPCDFICDDSRRLEERMELARKHYELLHKATQA